MLINATGVVTTISITMDSWSPERLAWLTKPEKTAKYAEQVDRVKA